MPRLRPLAAILAALVVLCAGSRAAGLQTHTLLVVNEGNEAIFALRLGHDSTPPVWSGDLLPFDRVIDVSEGRAISVSVDPADCIADLQAGYRDAHAIVLKDVDLCTTDRVNFQH
ncbi:MAG: hypothetical protein M3R30_05645 [Candidatus Eremiobacteraeota bacterium]|nr:hypothetical protein [Candidatus Eremiobacteraeota bacterium]